MNVVYIEAIRVPDYSGVPCMIAIHDVDTHQVEPMPPRYAKYKDEYVCVALCRDNGTRVEIIITPAQYEELCQKWEKGPIEMVLPHGGTDTGICIDTPFQ